MIIPGAKHLDTFVLRWRKLESKTMELGYVFLLSLEETFMLGSSFMTEN